LGDTTVGNSVALRVAGLVLRMAGERVREKVVHLVWQKVGGRVWTSDAGWVSSSAANLAYLKVGCWAMMWVESRDSQMVVG
jgi:hypothetical protein